MVNAGDGDCFLSLTIGAETDELLLSVISYQVKRCFVMYSEQLVGYPWPGIRIPP